MAAGKSFRPQHRYQSVKVARGDADDRNRLTVHCGLPPEDIRIACEVFLPVRITQDYHRIGAGGNSLLGAKKAPQQRLHAERLKVVAGHIAGQHPVRLVPLRTYTVQALAFAKDLGEYIPGSIPQFPILRQRQAWLRGVTRLLEPDLGNPAFVAYVHGAEEKPIRDAKDRGVDGDAECKGERRGRRKAGTAEQLPHGITKSRPRFSIGTKLFIRQISSRIKAGLPNLI